MNFTSILTAMSGPLNTALRYGVGYLGTYLLAKGWVDEGSWTAIGGGIMALGALLIGTLSSTAAVKTKAVAQLGDVRAVEKTDGTRVTGQ